jgi:hypothetical protein
MSSENVFFPGITLEDAEIALMELGEESAARVHDYVYSHCGAREDGSLYEVNWTIWGVMTEIFSILERNERPFPEDYPPAAWQRVMDFYHRAEAVETAYSGKG